MKVLKKSVKAKRQKTAKIKDRAKEITREKGVYKSAEFQAYIIWKSLPAVLRGQGLSTMNKFGVDDELSISLLEIKTQTEFAKRFKIKIGTCTEWNKILIDENLIYGSIKKWAKMITPNIVMALGKTAMKTGKAPEVMAWLKLIEGWEEKSKMGLDTSPKLLKILAKMDKLLP
ncbi:MAG: hypothetical protein ACTSUT_16140 [Promethearchaeota archaeon]